MDTTANCGAKSAFMAGVAIFLLAAGDLAIAGDDYGGGYLTRRLIYDIGPMQSDRNTGLFTRRLDGPITFADGKGLFYFQGQINLGASFVDNGNPDGTHSNFISSGAKPNRFGFRARYKFNEDLSFSAGLRVEGSFNRSDVINDFDDNAGCDEPDHDRALCLDRANIGIRSLQFGKIAVGLMEPATYEVGQINLAGTNYFLPARINTYVGGFEAFGAGRRWEELNPGPGGLERATVIRYDTPTFAGFTLSAAWGENETDDIWDTALRYAGEFGAFRVAAGAGYREADEEDSSREESAVVGSASIMHVPTGLFVNGGAAVYDRDGAGSPGAGDTDDASLWYVQGGIQQQWFSWGKTTITAQYLRSDSGARSGDFFRDNSHTDVFGLGVSQTIDAAATDIYAGYQQHDAEVDGISFVEPRTYFLGARLRF